MAYFAPTYLYRVRRSKLTDPPTLRTGAHTQSTSWRFQWIRAEEQ
jgi:hypothetical protein